MGWTPNRDSRRHQVDDDVEVDALLHYQNGKSTAIFLDVEDFVAGRDPIWLPTKEIRVRQTNRYDEGKEIVVITMPQWLAEDRELV